METLPYLFLSPAIHNPQQALTEAQRRLAVAEGFLATRQAQQLKQRKAVSKVPASKSGAKGFGASSATPPSQQAAAKPGAPAPSSAQPAASSAPGGGLQQQQGERGGSPAPAHTNVNRCALGPCLPWKKQTA